jgi:hypothetical protein
VQTSYENSGPKVSQAACSAARAAVRGRRSHRLRTHERGFNQLIIPMIHPECPASFAAQPEYGSFFGFDHIHWWVGNAKQAGKYDTAPAPITSAATPCDSA